MELLKLLRSLTQFLRNLNFLRLNARTTRAMMRRLSSSTSQKKLLKLSLKMVKKNKLADVMSAVLPKNILASHGIRLTQKTTTSLAPKLNV